MPPALLAGRNRARTYAYSIENGDLAGEPLDIDIELALAIRYRDPAAGGAAVREKANRADLVVQHLGLRGKQFDIQFGRQRVFALIAADFKTMLLDVQRQHGFFLVGDS